MKKIAVIILIMLCLKLEFVYAVNYLFPNTDMGIKFLAIYLGCMLLRILLYSFIVSGYDILWNKINIKNYKTEKL